jgi:hypothetical protein
VTALTILERFGVDLYKPEQSCTVIQLEMIVPSYEPHADSLRFASRTASFRSGSSFPRAEAARFAGFGAGRASLPAPHVVPRDGGDRETMDQDSRQGPY